MGSADVDLLMNQARDAVTKGDLPAARKLIEEAISLAGESASLHYQLATVCYLQKDHQAARVHFEATDRMDPRHAGAAINLGALCNLQGEHEEAVKHLQRGIQRDPSRAEGYYNLGIALRKLGRLELAVQAYREAQRLSPRMVEAVYNLANVYFVMGRFDQAISYYERALEINPGFTRAAEGLVRAKKQWKEFARPLDSGIILTDTRAGDPMELDRRLDRVLDPVRDHDMLTRFYVESEQTEICSQNWSQMTERLDAAIREVARLLTGNGPSREIQLALTRLRETVARFQSCRGKFKESFDHLVFLRDQLMKRA